MKSKYFMLNRYVYYHQVNSGLRTNKSLYRVILGCSDFLKLSVNKVIHVYMYCMLNIQSTIQLNTFCICFVCKQKSVSSNLKYMSTLYRKHEWAWSSDADQTRMEFTAGLSGCRIFTTVTANGTQLMYAKHVGKKATLYRTCNIRGLRSVPLAVDSKYTWRTLLACLLCWPP